MLILAMESSAKAASAAVARDGMLLDLEFQNDERYVPNLC